jgi:carboxypeptidase Taq
VIKRENDKMIKNNVSINFEGKRGYHKANKAIKKLRKGVNEVSKVNVEYADLYWESQTNNPSSKRLNEITLSLERLALLAKKMIASPAIKESLGRLEKYRKLNPLNKALREKSIEELEIATKIPEEFVLKKERMTVASNTAWAEARKNNDFEYFRPHLANMFKLTKEYTATMAPNKEPLDYIFSKGANNLGYTRKEIDGIFDALKVDLVPLVHKIISKSKAKEEILQKPANAHQMEEFAIEVAKDMGVDFKRAKIGQTEHSFMINIDSPNRIGIAISHPNKSTTTVDDCLGILTSFMHESGHGLVELGAAPKLHGTGLAGATLGIHESQSRLWQNNVGRSKEFWQHYYPKLQKKVEGFQDISFDDFYTAMNNVKASKIRTQADEVTYNLHIMLRHDLEKELLDPNLSNEELDKKIGQLPEKWNSKMEEYLGVKPKNDSEGVLRDVHWSEGLIGYFPSYAIGNLAAAQFMHIAKKQIPNLDAEISKGNLKPLKNWLTDKIYRHGQIYKPNEIIERVTGEPLNPKYFIEYLKNKYEVS